MGIGLAAVALFHLFALLSVVWYLFASGDLDEWEDQ